MKRKIDEKDSLLYSKLATFKFFILNICTKQGYIHPVRNWGEYLYIQNKKIALNSEIKYRKHYQLYIYRGCIKWEDILEWEGEIITLRLNRWLWLIFHSSNSRDSISTENETKRKLPSIHTLNPETFLLPHRKSFHHRSTLISHHLLSRLNNSLTQWFCDGDSLHQLHNKNN